MKSRLFVITALVLGLAALLILVTRTAQRRSREHNAPLTLSTAPDLADANGERIEPLREPAAHETKAERRAQMVSNIDYREDFKLSEQDIYLFVQSKGSNAVSLVAAFESTRDKAFLKAAAENYPNDPFVQAKALMWLDLTDEQRTKMLEDFKKSSPTNAFANFLAAKEAMKRGDTAAALAELAAAKGKGYEEYFGASAQGLEEAYLSAGIPEADAKMLGMSEITLPHLAQLKGLGRLFLDLAEKAAAAGDTKTQQEMLLANWEIGHKLRSASRSVPIITELVGIAMENHSLHAWPAGSAFGDRSTSDLLEANAADRSELRVAGPAFVKWFPTAPDEEIITYMNTQKSSGEREALKWLTELHPELKNAGRQPN